MFVYHITTHIPDFNSCRDGKPIKTPHSLTIYICVYWYLCAHAFCIHIETMSSARPSAWLRVRVYLCMYRWCICISGTTEWECDETSITHSTYSPIATLLRHSICVDRYAFPQFFGSDISASGREMENVCP